MLCQRSHWSQWPVNFEACFPIFLLLGFELRFLSFSVVLSPFSFWDLGFVVSHLGLGLRRHSTNNSKGELKYTKGDAGGYSVSKERRRQKSEGTMRVVRRKVKGRRAGARWVAGGLRQIYSFEWTGGFHSAPSGADF